MEKSYQSTYNDINFNYKSFFFSRAEAEKEHLKEANLELLEENTELKAKVGLNSSMKSIAVMCFLEAGVNS